MRHEFPVRVAGGVELVVTRSELNRGGGGLLFQARDPLLECLDIGRRAETAFSPGMSLSTWESFFSRWEIRWVCRVLRSKALARSACRPSKISASRAFGSRFSVASTGYER